MSHTPLDVLLDSLARAGAYNRNDQVAPAAVLWTDKDRQWEALMPRLRPVLPHLLTLGTYDPATRTGPAIWLKCMISRTLPEADWPKEVIPILYLPGVSRQELRAVEECPKHLQPLAALQYRSVYWTQQNSKDWTLLAFLQSKDGGLGLDVSRDSATQDAMTRALLVLVDTPIGVLQNRRLEAADFDALLTPDPVRDLLSWLDDPVGTRGRWDESAWGAFRSVCREQFSFDPETDDVLEGAEHLGHQQGPWKKVWDRFAEAPVRYPQLPERLRQARPSTPLQLFHEASPTWPQDNEAMESELREALLALRDQPSGDATASLMKLEKRHGERRDWVWAALGCAPLAYALRHLVSLATVTQTPLSGAIPDEMAQAYTEGGWRADAAVLDGLRCVKSAEDVEAIITAIQAVYRPWLNDAAYRFQDAVNRYPLPGCPVSPTTDKRPHDEQGVVILFVDGLRYDLGQKLKTVLLDRGWRVEDRWRWVALPTVTPTAKPAGSPVWDLLTGDEHMEEFRPLIAATGKSLTIDRFRQLLSDQGYQVLREDETGDPSGRAWAEIGDFDRYGHEQGWKLARRIDEVLQEVVHRIASLLEAGWSTVRVITDHGWLLLPRGLPKSEMPKHLVDTRWGRCAVLKETSVVEMPAVSWFWNPHVHIAMAPGISVFKNGLEYAHGGLSIQECLAMELTITQEEKQQSLARITTVEWFGLRCRVSVEGHVQGVRADVRTKAADSVSSISTPRPVNEQGPTALFVEDDRYDGISAVVVLLTPDGRVIARYPTTVGE